MAGINSDIWLASFVSSAIAWDYATYPSKVIIVSSTNCRSVAGSSTHKNDATGNGRPAPLLAEPRYGAAPQPYGEYLSNLSVCPVQPSRLFTGT